MTLIFGWLAGAFSTAYNIPQIYLIYKTKSAKDISLYSLIIRIISYVFYILHATMIEDPPLLYMTAAVLSQALIMSMQKFVYRNSKSAIELATNAQPENSSV